jgi:geranylgeranyl pyrophosphate synthase
MSNNIITNGISLMIIGTDGKILLKKRSKDDLFYPLALDFAFNQETDSIENSFPGINLETRLKPLLKIKYTANVPLKKNEINELSYAELDSEIFVSDNHKWLIPTEINQMLKQNIYFTPLFRKIWSEYFSTSVDCLEVAEIMNEVYTGNIVDFGNITHPAGDSETEYLLELPVSYISSVPGKDLRRMIIEILGEIYEIDHDTTELIAQTVNKIHSASLVLDDVEDRSRLRRGVKCAHLIFGETFAINTSFHQISKTIFDIMRTAPDFGVPFGKAIYDLITGQTCEMYWNEFKSVPNHSELERIMHLKTSPLFVCALDCITVQTKNSRVIEYQTNGLTDLFYSFLKKIGLWFQIKDDLINLTDAEYWKKKGFCDDFDEQKYSYPVVLFYELESEDTEAFGEKFYINDKTDEDKNDLLDILNKYNIFDLTQARLSELEKEIMHILLKIGAIDGTLVEKFKHIKRRIIG